MTCIRVMEYLWNASCTGFRLATVSPSSITSGLEGEPAVSRPSREPSLSDPAS